MKKILGLLLILFTLSLCVSAQPRNILTGIITRKSLKDIIVSADHFSPCPVAGEWSGLDQKVREELIKSGEKLLNTNWGELKAMTFMEYKINGNRSNYEVTSLTRRISLNSLVTAEAMENKSRFIGDIVNGIWAICEESYWGVPATNNLQKRSKWIT